MSQRAVWFLFPSKCFTFTYFQCLAFRNEEEMYKVLLNEYEQCQKQLLVENAELKKLLQHMKKEIISLLPPQNQKPKEKHEEGNGIVSAHVCSFFMFFF